MQFHFYSVVLRQKIVLFHLIWTFGVTQIINSYCLIKESTDIKSCDTVRDILETLYPGPTFAILGYGP